MRNRKSLLAACVLAAVGFSAPMALAWAPPTDEEVSAAIKSFEGEVREAQSKGPVTAEVLKQAADTAVEGLDIGSMTVSQIGDLSRARVVASSSKAEAFVSRLKALSAQTSGDGAEAAAINVSLLRSVPDAAEQQEILRTALRHPGLAGALREGRAAQLFMGIRAAKAEALEAVAGDVLALEKVLSPEMPPSAVSASASLMDALVTLPEKTVTPGMREPLRLKILALAESAAGRLSDSPEDKRIASSLESVRTRLNGAFMRGELMNHPAPRLDFIWSSTAPPIASLDDLKGKVVVLDFWATWCGPCVASFPDVRKLRAHYEGYPVVILGVTSIQGSHTPKGGKRIDLKDEPEKEMGLMAGYMKEAEVTWPVAFSKQGVFNPDYGVNGIPHVAIIDARGVVRHRALHPNSRYTPFKDKTEKIDALLREAGLPAPAAAEEPADNDKPVGG